MDVTTTIHMWTKHVLSDDKLLFTMKTQQQQGFIWAKTSGRGGTKKEESE